MDSIYDAYETDAKAEEDGTDIELRNGAILRIRSENSTKVRNYIAKLVRKQRHVILREGGSLPADLQDKNEIDICADVLIVGWRKVSDRAGNEIPYSKENVRKLVTELPSLRRDIMTQARLEDTFRRDEGNQISGNSAGQSGQASGQGEAT